MKRHRGALTFFAGLAVSLTLGWSLFPKALYRQVEQPLRFSHRVHTGEAVGMACDACHRIDAGRRFVTIPPTSTCAECHAQPVGDSPDERTMVTDYIRKGREIPWLVYSRQPDHVSFSHPLHVKLANLPCERCHGALGRTDAPPPYEENRLTGYSRRIWGRSIARVGLEPGEGNKMDDCSNCHRERGVAESCIDCHK